MEAVYRLRGDMLEICFSANKKGRPKTFEPKKGDNLDLIRLRRENP